MRLQFVPITSEDLSAYKTDMQEAFQCGAAEGGYPIEKRASDSTADALPSGEELILPEEDIDRSLATPGAIAYKAVAEGVMVGGAIVVVDAEAGYGHLDFLYVKHGTQSRGIGKFMWFEIERRHPEVRIWETCTPYFEKRNIHFYVNVCGFHIVEYWNPHHPDPHMSAEVCDEDDGMFGFRKVLPAPSRKEDATP